MDPANFQECVMSTAAPNTLETAIRLQKLLAVLSRLIHAITVKADELDVLKKYVFYNKPPTDEVLVDEWMLVVEERGEQYNKALTDGATITQETFLTMAHAAIGMATEAGEILACLQNVISSSMIPKEQREGEPKPDMTLEAAIDLNNVNFFEETFDSQWYVGLATSILGPDGLTNLQLAGLAKLKARYPNKFRETDAVHRTIPTELAPFNSLVTKTFTT